MLNCLTLVYLKQFRLRWCLITDGPVSSLTWDCVVRDLRAGGRKRVWAELAELVERARAEWVGWPGPKVSALNQPDRWGITGFGQGRDVAAVSQGTRGPAARQEAWSEWVNPGGKWAVMRAAGGGSTSRRCWRSDGGVIVQVASSSVRVVCRRFTRWLIWLARSVISSYSCWMLNIWKTLRLFL